MKYLELKLPPPLVALIVSIAMWWGAGHGPAFTLAPQVTDIVLGLLVTTALVFDMSGLIKFLQRNTTINPWTPQKSSALVTSGIYRITRNPMYVGLFLLLMAWAIYLGWLIALLGPVAFALYIHYFQIMPEEKILTAIFGDEYIRYTQTVRRWI